MFNKGNIIRRLPILLFITALVLFAFSMAGNGSEGNVERVAKSAKTRIRNRINILDTYILKALDNSLDDNICLDDLPDDMVIYKYVNDSLKSWSNQFSVLNDDISTKMVFQRLTNLKNRLVSPLIDVTEELSYMNLGPKWYLVKLVTGDNNEKVIAGIEIKNTLIDDIRRNDNGINRHLNIPARYTVLPLNYSGGTAVSIDDKPLFKIICDSTSLVPFFTNSLLRWLGLIFLTLASILFLAGKSMNLSKKHLNDYQLASRVIIAGGRDFNDYEYLSTKLNELFKDQNVFNNKAIKVISGMAKGTDTLGIKIVPPIWG